MDKKKLIGTIIGVTMFAALIVGATFAWLTFAATITNGTYNTTAEEFVINYTGGQAITKSLDILASPTVLNVTQKMTVSAYKTNASSTGKLYIKLTSSSNNTLTTGNVIRYTVCSGTSSASSCTGSLINGTGVLTTGSVNKTGEMTLYETTNIRTADNKDNAPTTEPLETTYYWIYFWMDAATIQNSHLGQTYSGYIHASATQS